MTTFTQNNSKFSKSFSKVAARLMLGLSASLVFLPMEKALADRPVMYGSGENLSISYTQCQDKAMKAASTILSSLKKPVNEDGIFILLGKTYSTITVIYCVEKPVGSSFIVNTSSNYDSGEASSVNNRIVQIMLGQL